MDCPCFYWHQQLWGQKLSEWVSHFTQIDFGSLSASVPKGEMSFSTPPFQHSPAPDLDTLSPSCTAACCPPAPVLVSLWWTRCAVPALFGCHCPSRHYGRCFPSSLPTPGRAPFAVRHLPLGESRVCRSSALLSVLFSGFLQSSPLKFEQKVLLLLEQEQ